jgi:hypothetical protein
LLTRETGPIRQTFAVITHADLEAAAAELDDVAGAVVVCLEYVSRRLLGR